MKIGWIIGLGVLASSLNLSIAARVFADGGDTTLVHGCVNNNTKATRIVGANANCQNNETTRHWPTAARIVADETRITNTETTNTNQNTSITAILTKNTQQDAAIATLQGQVGGGSGGLVVKDSLGQVVGKVSDNAGQTIFFKIGNDPLTTSVTGKGFLSTIGTFSFYHTTNDCSGTRYFLSERSHNGNFTEFVQTIDGQTGYYASQPAQELLIQSIENNVPDPGFLGVGDCDNFFAPGLIFLATPATINLNSLGTPPFRLE